MNKVILMGRLVRDPEIAWTSSADSKKYAKYTLAVNRRFKKEGQPDADFIQCMAWGAMAEFAEKFMKKGGMFSVVGHINVSSWDDNEGKKRWNTTVVVEEHYFAESKKESGEKRDSESNGAAAGNRQAESKPADVGNSAAGYGKQMRLSTPQDGGGGEADFAKQSGDYAEQEGFYPIEESLEDDDLPF